MNKQDCLLSLLQEVSDNKLAVIVCEEYSRQAWNGIAVGIFLTLILILVVKLFKN